MFLFSCLSHSVVSVVAATMVIFVLVMPPVDATPIPTETYMKERQQLLAEDSSLRMGAKLVLQPDEKIVSDIFVKEKQKLANASRFHRALYPPALSFFKSKPLIDNSTLLKLIQRMPKGAVLHTHDQSLASLEWLVKNGTYRDNVYMCVKKPGYLKFKAFKVPPKQTECKWTLVREERAKAKNVEEFDQYLIKNISMLATDPVVMYADNGKAWIRFLQYFDQVAELISYAPIFRDYYRRGLEEFRADNVQYLELRTLLVGVYDLNGTVYKADQILQIYLSETEKFVAEFPDFSGAKLILSGSRSNPKENITEQVKTAVDLNKKYPNFMMGYDLVSDEVMFHPLIYYIDALLYPARLDPPYHLPYFFHAGETVWEGTYTDDNLADALLLNTTRIGHGYALNKHPKLAKMVKDRDIAVEVNPISNQVLRLVTDLRNHPMASLMADGFPIVISSDDPSTWESLPLSHDYYMAFMDMSGEYDDLRFLKQLAINSIQYSVMNTAEKAAAMKLWQKKWDTFIKETVLEYSHGTFHL